MTGQRHTRYRIEWLLPNNEVRYNRAELYDSMALATIAAETIKGELGAQYAPLLRRWMVDADYRIATVTWVEK